MSGLQRSQVSFRRQGSSGLVWDDKFLSGELNQEGKPLEKAKQEQQNDIDQHAKTTAAYNKSCRDKDIPAIDGGRGYRTGRVSPALDPPSPKLSACGFCTAFGKATNTKKPAKRRSR